MSNTNYVIYEPPRSEVSDYPDATIIVNYNKRTGIDYCILDSPLPKGGGSIPIDEIPNIEAFWHGLEPFLSYSVTQNALSSKESLGLWRNIEGLGQKLYETFLPAELQKCAKQWKQDATVIISTNEQWIPWELVHDGNNFWGSKFNLARIPRLPDRSAHDHNFVPPTQQPQEHVFGIANIIGGNLGVNTTSQVKNLFARVAPNAVSTSENAALIDVLKFIENTAIVHFTCHGHIDPPCLQLGNSVNSHHSNLYVSSLRQLKRVNQSIVFANACMSANAGSLLGKLCSFGWEFYKNGSGTYIGTLGPVPTIYAIKFAEHFYENMLYSGQTVGQALRFALQSAELDNPFWLLYCLYGNPFTKKSCPIIG